MGEGSLPGTRCCQVRKSDSQLSVLGGKQLTGLKKLNQRHDRLYLFPQQQFCFLPNGWGTPPMWRCPTDSIVWPSSRIVQCFKNFKFTQSSRMLIGRISLMTKAPTPTGDHSRREGCYWQDSPWLLPELLGGQWLNTKPKCLLRVYCTHAGGFPVFTSCSPSQM